MNPTQLIPIALVLFIGWRVTMRLRRSVGRQQLQPARLVARIAFFALITGFVTFSAAPNLVSVEAELAGLATGIALAFVGLKLTRFEMTTEGNFYVPNAYLGVALTLLFVGRIAYRFLTITQNPNGFAAPNPALLQSPLTLLIFGVTAGYYIAYSAGILFRGRKVIAAPSIN